MIDGARQVAGGNENYTVLYAVGDTNVDTLLDLYTAALEDAGWTVDYADGSDGSGSVVGGLGDGSTEGSLLVSIAPSLDLAGVLEVSVFVSIPER